MTERRARIQWTGPALADLRNAREYVSRDNPEAARRLAAAVLSRVDALVDHPTMGRLVPELPQTGYRELIVAPYRIVYETSEDRKTVTILRVWHGRGDLASTE